VSREEKRDATVVWRTLLLVLAVPFIRCERSSPGRFAKFYFGDSFILAAVFSESGCRTFRCIREPECDRRPIGFQGLSMLEFGRTSQDQVLMDSEGG
jgi:hypothetical protein